MKPVRHRQPREPFTRTGLQISVIAFAGGVYFAITGSVAVALAAFLVGAAFSFLAWKSAARQAPPREGWGGSSRRNGRQGPGGK